MIPAAPVLRDAVGRSSRAPPDYLRRLTGLTRAALTPELSWSRPQCGDSRPPMPSPQWARRLGTIAV